MDIRTRLQNYFRASFPGVAIETTEEARAMTDVIEAAKACGKALVTWSATEGMRHVFPTSKEIDDTEDLLSACRQRFPDTIYVLRDIHTWPFDRDPILPRGLRDLLTWAPTDGSGVVIISPNFKPHGTFEKLVTVFDYSLPDTDDLARIVAGISESANKTLAVSDDLIRALGGMSTTEAENALSLSLVETGKFESSIIYREKVQAVRKTGLLDIVEADPRGLDAIGGLEDLKAWITKRKRAYSPEAKKFGLPTPKGVLIVGVPGTGKSLSAKAFGTALSIPTVRLDIGSLFNSLVGESESRTRDALKLAEAMAPCVLWVDEIDKGLAGSSGSGSGDSGVTRRVFGSIISWMQDRKRPVFLVATANQVESLPPELLRKGRFDEIFAVDLPRFDEREAIFRIHLIKAGRDPDTIAIPPCAKATEGFTGSEIEAVIYEALFTAFDENTELEAKHIMQAIQETTPLSVTAKEQIESIRAWANSRARFASSKVMQDASTSGKRRFSSVKE